MEVSATNAQEVPRRRTGRPLSFDRAVALEQAMLLFWRYGYETTSVADLTAVMGISAPSLYAAFGDKKRLFLESARLYAGDPEQAGLAIDSAPTARAAARDLLLAAAETYTGETTPKGCLLASATASGSLASADVQAAVTAIRDAIRDRIADRIRRDMASGLLPPDADAAALSGLVVALTIGMSGLARDGLDRDALVAVANAALQSWPRLEP